MKYFGTDGIRGIPNQKLSVEFVSKLGKALKELGNTEVAIATDTRISKDMLSYAIAAGCMSVGINVHILGVLPTPALIYYSYFHQYTGVVITASHNPYTDNGIKILDRGKKLSEYQEESIEKVIDNPKAYEGNIGKIFQEESALDEYIQFIKQETTSTNLKICIDCANGATYKTAPQIFNQITQNLVVTASDPDGYNINKDVGSTHLEHLIQKVKEEHCDIGFAFDGDGDRVLCVDAQGNKIDGDMLIYILARDLKEKNKLNSNKVVLTQMSNLGLIKDLNKHGIDVIETPVGDKNVIKALTENHLSVGGENSGHIILPDIFHTGDGVLVACKIIDILEKKKISITQYLKPVEMYSDKMVNVSVADRNKVMNSNALFERKKAIEEELNKDCKIIIRPSGTEDVIRVSVMAKSMDLVLKYSKELVEMIESI